MKDRHAAFPLKSSRAEVEAVEIKMIEKSRSAHRTEPLSLLDVLRIIAREETSSAGREFEMIRTIRWRRTLKDRIRGNPQINDT
jgi:hypothetical protein